MGCGANRANSNIHSHNQVMAVKYDLPVRPISLNKGNFILQFAGDVRKQYSFGKVVGKGSYGEVVSAIHYATKAQRAIKLIRKSLLDPKLGKETIINEFNMLKSLDHPNVVRVYEAYEDNNYVYIVTEFLSGGDLFSDLLKEGKYSEQKTAEITKQILQGLSYCHQSNLAHRDLKLQNLLLESKDEGEIFVKLIDFGLSKFFAKNAIFKEAIGTPLFMAPEILKQQQYDCKVDIWSLGIMVFMMLTGTVPFPIKDAKSLFKRICECDIKKEFFAGLKYLSEDSTDFMTRCLCGDPKQRSSAAELLDHSWITTKVRPIITDAMESQIKDSLIKFNTQFSFEQAVYTYLAMNAATREDEKYLRELFISMDKSKDGKINKEEFVAGMLNGKVIYTQKELEDIFNGLDSDNSGVIDYSEFLKAAIDKKKLCTDDKLKSAFGFFDLDGNGVITKSELLEVFKRGNAYLTEEMCLAMVNEIDKNKDMSISFEEFKQMMNHSLENNQQ